MGCTIKSGESLGYEFAGKIFELLELKPELSPTSTAAFGAKARHWGGSSSLRQTRRSAGK